MRKYWLLMAALVIGTLLRFVALGHIPLGLTWDEAAISYDAWGIADWHRDQHATLMPLTFKSFGDYKPPFLHYILAVWYMLFGVSITAIRYVSAFSGVVLIVMVYMLTHILFGKRILSGVAAVLVAISPWSVHMSRIGFEANVVIPFLVAGVIGMLLAYRHWGWMLLAGLMFAVSVYVYQSTKIVAPLLFGWGLYYISRIDISRRVDRHVLGLGAISFLVGLGPFVYSIFGGGLDRGKQALLFFEDDRFVFGARQLARLLANTLQHLSLDFLIYGQQDTFRNIVPGFGIFLGVSLGFFIVGLIVLYREQRTVWALLSGWILIGILPSIVSTTSPHTLRSASILPVIVVFEAVGLVWLLLYVRKTYARWYVSIMAGIILIYTLSYGAFLKYYVGGYAIDSAMDFQYGYEEALAIAQEELRTADTLVVTETYGQPYIYTLLYFRYTPEQFHQGALANVRFGRIDWPNNETNTVFVATADEIPLTDDTVIDSVVVPETDTVVFVIARK